MWNTGQSPISMRLSENTPTLETYWRHKLPLCPPVAPLGCSVLVVLTRILTMRRTGGTREAVRRSPIGCLGQLAGVSKVVRHPTPAQCLRPVLLIYRTEEMERKNRRKKMDKLPYCGSYTTPRKRNPQRSHPPGHQPAMALVKRLFHCPQARESGGLNTKAQPPNSRGNSPASTLQDTY